MKKCRLLVLIALALILVWGGVSCKQEPAFYTVKFEKNADKAEGEMNPQLVKSNTETQLNQNLFTRQFYVFAGWSLTEDGKVEYKDKDKVKLSSDATLYAQWVPDKMTIKFDADDEKAQGKMDDIVANAKSLIKLTKNAFTLEGYHFDSWYDEDFKEYNDEGEYEFIKDTTLYAWWEPNTYTVKYNVNVEGSEQTMPDQKFEYDDEDFLSENTFTNPGHVFKCWNTKTDGTGTDYLDYQAVENLTAVDKGIVTLYAQWEEDSLAGTTWKMQVGPSSYVSLVFGEEEASIYMAEELVISGEYSRTDDKFTLISKQEELHDNDYMVYAYIEPQNNELVCFDKRPDLDIAAIVFERNFGFPTGINGFPLDMEELEQHEGFEDDYMLEVFYVDDEDSYSTLFSAWWGHSSYGEETFTSAETREYEAALNEAGNEDWTFRLTGDYSTIMTAVCAYVINVDEIKEETTLTICMALGDEIPYGAYTFTLVEQE